MPRASVTQEAHPRGRTKRQQFLNRVKGLGFSTRFGLPVRSANRVDKEKHAFPPPA